MYPLVDSAHNDSIESSRHRPIMVKNLDHVVYDVWSMVVLNQLKRVNFKTPNIPRALNNFRRLTFQGQHNSVTASGTLFVADMINS